MLRYRVLRGTKRERELLSGRSGVRILSWVPKPVSAIGGDGFCILDFEPPASISIRARSDEGAAEVRILYRVPSSEIPPHGSKKAIAFAVAFSSSVLRVSSSQNRTRSAGLRFCCRRERFLLLAETVIKILI